MTDHRALGSELDCAIRHVMETYRVPRFFGAADAARILLAAGWDPTCTHTPSHEFQSILEEKRNRARGLAPGACVFVFDLDGTLVQNGARIDWEDAETFPKHCRPYLDAWARVGAVQAAGHRVVFLSGRGPHLLDVTRRQVLEYGGYFLSKCPIVLREAPAFSWDRYVDDKVDCLVAQSVAWPGVPVVYVGDRDEDQTAAAIAGAVFIRAEVWRAGIPWEPIVAAVPGSDVRIAAASSHRKAADLGVLPALRAIVQNRAPDFAGVHWPEAAVPVGSEVDSAGGKAYGLPAGVHAFTPGSNKEDARDE